jgi:hypothetical protein
VKHLYFATALFLAVTARAELASQFSTNVDAVGLHQGVATNGSSVDSKTLFGKVMCGYQGWFGAPGDGSQDDRWRHWTKGGGPLADGNAKIDLWPDISELSPAERFKTELKLPDGQTAQVFSSYVKATVLRHFQWMRDYGIDGVFVQRFAVGLKNQKSLNHNNAVLANCREGAQVYGRTYAIMYDLSGMTSEHISEIIEDWRALGREVKITRDRAYLFHRNKPVVAIWGVGFNDHRNYSLADCRRLIEFFKNDPENGGCTVMLGVPAYWRQLRNDAVGDPELLKVVSLADIVSPWTVGRYTTIDEARRYADTTLVADAAWCREHEIDFLPVVFPGFSWHNMYGAPLNQIPRLRGQFLWSQFCSVKRAGIPMAYVAMFDELDEGTAIFKCSNTVPVGPESQFVTFEGLPTDFYLKLVGKGTKLIRGEIPLTARAGNDELLPPAE